MTYVTLRLKLPDDIDYAQKQIYHEDFRIKMTNVGLDLHLKNARGTTVIKNLQFSVGDKAAMFVFGTLLQIAETHETLRRIKIFTDAYCCLYDFVWSLNDITTTPDYSKKKAGVPNVHGHRTSCHDAELRILIHKIFFSGIFSPASEIFFWFYFAERVRGLTTTLPAFVNSPGTFIHSPKM